MPDARVQSAIDALGAALRAGGRRLQRLRAHDRGRRALGGLARRVAGAGRRARGDGARGRDRRRAGSPPATRGCAPPSPTTSPSSSGCSTPDRSRAVADLAVEAMYAAHRSLDPTAERIEAPLDDAAVVRQPAPAGARRAPAARAPDPRPGLDQGGVLHARGGVPAPRHGDAVARRAGPGRGRLPAADPARLRGRGRGGARHARRPPGPRPRARRRARRQPRRLLRAARGGVRAADPRRRRDQRGVQLRRAVGLAARADARDVRAEVGRARRRRRARAGAGARPRRRARAARPRRRCSSPAGATG